MSFEKNEQNKATNTSTSQRSPVAHVHAFGQGLQDPDHLLHRRGRHLELTLSRKW